MRNPVIKRLVIGFLRWFAVTMLPVVFLTMVWCATLGSFNYWTFVHSSPVIFFTGLSCLAGMLIAIGMDENPDELLNL